MRADAPHMFLKTGQLRFFITVFFIHGSLLQVNDRGSDVIIPLEKKLIIVMRGIDNINIGHYIRSQDP